MIHFKKHNELYVKIDGLSIDQAQILFDEYSFFKSDYFYTRNFYQQTNADDGKVHLFNPYKHTIPKGLLLDVLKVFKELDIPFTLDKSLAIPNFGEWIDEYMKLEHAMPYQPHQYDIIRKSLMCTSGAIQSPTGSGKSFIIFSLAVFFKKYLNCKCLITVPSIALVKQLYGDFQQYDSHGFLTNQVQMIYGKTSKTLDMTKSIVISTYQSAAKKPPAFFSRFNMYIQDEVHGGDCASSLYILNNLALTAKYRFGLTGTFKNNDPNNIKGGLNLLQVRGYFGFHIKGESTKSLIDAGRLPPLDIRLLMLEHKPQYFDTFQDEMSYIVDNQVRNKIIANLAKTLKGNTLILVHLREHAARIHDLIDPSLNKFLILGDYSDIEHSKNKVQLIAERDAIRDFTETHENVVIIASFSFFQQGISINNLHNLILAYPNKSSVRTLQSIGRLLRKHPNKKQSTIIDIIDDFGYKSSSLRQANVRIKLYKEEGFPCTPSTIKLYK